MRRQKQTQDHAGSKVTPDSPGAFLFTDIIDFYLPVKHKIFQMVLATPGPPVLADNPVKEGHRRYM